MLTLLKKEISSFLSSLIGYIVITVFLLINGLFLWLFQGDFNIFDFGYANLDGLFMIAPFVFLFLIPAITMRLFADEKKTGTMELLLTKPLTEFEIVMAKFLSGLILVIFSLLPTLVYFFSIYNLGLTNIYLRDNFLLIYMGLLFLGASLVAIGIFVSIRIKKQFILIIIPIFLAFVFSLVVYHVLPKGNIDTGGMWGSYAGLLFLGASFVAIGMFASTLTDNQIVSFIIAVFLCGFLYVGFDFIYSFALFGKVDLLIKSLGINDHYQSMSRGVLDTRDMLYFLGIISLFILLSKYSIERRKW